MPRYANVFLDEMKLPICVDNYTTESADSLCRQLGFTEAIQPSPLTYVLHMIQDVTGVHLSAFYMCILRLSNKQRNVPVDHHTGYQFSQESYSFPFDISNFISLCFLTVSLSLALLLFSHSSLLNSICVLGFKEIFFFSPNLSIYISIYLSYNVYIYI